MIAGPALTTLSMGWIAAGLAVPESWVRFLFAVAAVLTAAASVVNALKSHAGARAAHTAATASQQAAATSSDIATKVDAMGNALGSHLTRVESAYQAFQQQGAAVVQSGQATVGALEAIARAIAPAASSSPPPMPPPPPPGTIPGVIPGAPA